MTDLVTQRRPDELASPYIPSQAALSITAPSPLVAPSAPTSLVDILENAAKTQSHCTFFTESNEAAKTLSYAELYSLARARAPLVAALAMSYQTEAKRPTVLLHFDSMELNIVWFWATIVAGLDVAVLNPLPTNLEQRNKHLTHLSKVLNKPLVLTSTKIVHDVSATEGFHISVIEQLEQLDAFHINTSSLPLYDCGRGRNPMVLMLTSGSSGNAKAVELEAAQIIAAIKGKVELLASHNRDVFLNWIGFDHVANLTECHLHAMYLAAEQIHVPASEIISDPWLFLSLINRYRITAAFSPNFFLARLLQAVEESSIPATLLDLSCLRRITSGGEANVVDTATRLTKALQRFRASDDFIQPGFGMTETCAGAIQNRSCPSYDVRKDYEFTSLGVPGNSIQMRILKEDGSLAGSNEVGVLQVTGSGVFKKYHNNPKATAEAFTDDGWFITGDKAFIDENQRLCLSGRDKEVINLNGVKYYPHEIEAALEEACSTTGATPTYTAVFSVRPQNATHEEICVLYHPNFSLEDIDARMKAAREITRIVGERTSARPKHVVPLPKALLPKTALGKLSRAKLRAALEKGDFVQYEDRLNKDIQAAREAAVEEPATDTERIVFEEVSALLSNTFDTSLLGVTNSILDFGITSTDLFILKQRLESRFSALITTPGGIPIGTFLHSPNIRGIASSLETALASPTTEYSHFVPLQTEGSKAPLFLIHPGSGDVLIFVHLAKYFPDRPVYGIRTRALYSGDDYFETIHEMAATYVAGIRAIQPHGPYAIAGYSLGSTVAFEVTKLLESEGEQVPFTAVLDSPPHFRHLVSHLGFIDVLVNVAYFLELITESYAVAGQISLKELDDEGALQAVLDNAPPERLKVLGIDKTRLRKITEVTWSFGKAAKDYDPTGSVGQLDVFWVHPLLWVAKDREEWMEVHLKHWVNFVRDGEGPKWHACEGIHSLMLNGDYVDGVARKMRRALADRGV